VKDVPVLDAVESRELDELMRDFYEVISFEEGDAPDWDRMAQLFSQHGRITRLTPEGIDYMILSTFHDIAEELIELGFFTSFLEREVARRADRYGDVMHVASAYETRVSPRAVDFIERGVNSLQLLRENGEWKILSLCWDNAAPFNMNGLELLTAGVHDAAHKNAIEPHTTGARTNGQS